jgi:poly-gamma-glutamate synthesis protein (capsule biosynthesis protein)
MVSTTAWYKITSLILVGLALVVLLPKHPVEETYSATNHELDIAVVEGISKADKSSMLSKARAAVVPHHLVASEAVALGVKAVSLSHPKLIVVISPDHYGKCSKLLCTTYGKYKTFFGDVTISKNAVSDLLSDKDIVAESDLFVDEHGVYSIVPFIKHYAPDARIVPIAVSQKGRGDDASRQKILSLLGRLIKDNDTALIISSDFSHYLPLEEAERMDKKTQSSFCSGNSQELLDLQNPSQSDCPLCLWVLYEEAIKYGFWNPSLLWHSNSANLLHDITVKETTSHFTFVLGNTSTSSCKRK